MRVKTSMRHREVYPSQVPAHNFLPAFVPIHYTKRFVSQAWAGNSNR